MMIRRLLRSRQLFQPTTPIGASMSTYQSSSSFPILGMGSHTTDVRWKGTVSLSSITHPHHRGCLRTTTMITSTTRRSFSSTFSSPLDRPNATTNTKNTGGTSSTPHCDVIQGPSLLRTPLSRPQPSLLFLPGLRSLPYWTTDDGEEYEDDTKDNNTDNDTGPSRKAKRIAYNDPTVTHVVQYLESHVDTIRDEYLRVSPTQPSDYQTNGHNGTADKSLHHGQWDWQSYMSKGSIQGGFVQNYPQTSSILQQLRSDHLLFEGTPFGFVFFSTLHPQSKIDAHTGPMNLRLRIHLPLLVPNERKQQDNNNNKGEGREHDGDEKDGTLNKTTNERHSRQRQVPLCGIQVGTYHPPRRWVNGSAMVLDDSYVHHVWNDTTKEKRVILLVDIWHPDITTIEKEAIVGMFQQAKLDGLWKR